MSLQGWAVWREPARGLDVCQDRCASLWVAKGGPKGQWTPNRLSEVVPRGNEASTGQHEMSDCLRDVASEAEAGVECAYLGEESVEAAVTAPKLRQDAALTPGEASV